MPEAKKDDKLDAQHLQEWSMWCQIILQLYVELYHTVHGDRDRNGLEACHPDVRITRVLGARAVTALRLSHNRDDCEERANKAILENTDPDNLCFRELVIESDPCSRTYVEPRQPAPWLPQPALVLASRALLHPCDWPDPVLWLHVSEILLLLVQIRRNVVAHEREEAGNGEGFIAVSQNLEVYGFLVIEVAEEGDDGVNRDHDENSNDAAAVSLWAMAYMCRLTVFARTASSSVWHAGV